MDNIRNQTKNIVQDISDDLTHQMEILIFHTNDLIVENVFIEILENFRQNEYLEACAKLNVIMKNIVQNPLFFQNKIRVLDNDDYYAITDLSLALSNAIAIFESPSLQNLIVEEQKND